MSFIKQSILLASLFLSFPAYSDISGYYRCSLDITAINKSFTDQYVSVVQKSDGSAIFAPVDIGASPLAFVGYGSGTVNGTVFTGKTNAGEDFKFTMAASATGPSIAIDKSGKEVQSNEPPVFKTVIYGSIGFKVNDSRLQANAQCDKVF